jgi:gluconate 5-dehydrogenase
MIAQRFDVSGRVACVTGASSGIGRHLATALVEVGAKVVGVARRAGRLEEWRHAAGDGAAAVAADLADPAQMEDVARRVSEPFGAPDILITAAGMNNRERAGQVTLEGWSATINLNLAAPYFLAQALVPAMQAKGWGRIVNIASLQTVRAMPGGISYGASKAAIGQLTRAEAEAWSKDGITANAIAPGFFETELTGPVFANAELAQKNAAQTCVGRNGVLDDLVGPALFFCSPASDYVTGQVLFVDGGFTAK